MKKMFLLLCVMLGACGGGGGNDDLSGKAEPQPKAAPSYVELTVGDEPYLMRCDNDARSIVVVLHTWNGDHRQVLVFYPDGITGACVVSQNFNGPNKTPQALASDDALSRIDRVIHDARTRTGLATVDMIAASGGTLAALGYIAEYPGIRRASLWLPIYDLESLYHTTADDSLRVDMVSVIGRPPGLDDADYLARSPRKRLERITPGVEIHINVASSDTTTPPAQGHAARDAIQAKGVLLTYKEWSIGHVFGLTEQIEAIRQITLN